MGNLCRLFMGFITLAGCAGTVIYGPTRVATRENPDQLYAASEHVMARRGWRLYPRKEAARELETAYVRIGEFDQVAGYLEESYLITINEQGIEVLTRCRWNNRDRRITSCSERRLIQIKHNEAKLLRDILDDSRTLAPVRQGQDSGLSVP
jgi:hypothetical protein